MRLSAWGGVLESVRALARLDAASRPAHAYLLVERLLLLLLLHEEQRIDLPPRQTFSAPPLPHVVFIRLMAPPSLTHPPLTLYHGGRCAHQAHGAPLTHTTPSRCLMVEVQHASLIAGSKRKEPIRPPHPHPLSPKAIGSMWSLDPPRAGEDMRSCQHSRRASVEAQRPAATADEDNGGMPGAGEDM